METVVERPEAVQVQLHCHADSAKLAGALHAARRELQQRDVSVLDEADRKAIESFIRRRTIDILTKIELCTTSKEPERLDVPEPLPENVVNQEEATSVTSLEQEVQQLQKQVIEAAERVSKLRREGPGKMYEQQRAALLASRPPAPPSEQSMYENSGDSVLPENAAFKASSEALHELMEASAADVPALRAEVDDSMNRLARVLIAMNASQELVAPNTVERAFRPPDSRAAGEPSPQLADALSAGKIVTRRRIASHMRPVPYPLH